MTYRVHVERDLMIDGIAVSVVDTSGVSSRVLTTLDFAGTSWAERRVGESVSPSFRIDGELARELFNALVDYYGGLPADRQLRKDYDHERGRVDRMLKAILDGAVIASRQDPDRTLRAILDGAVIASRQDPD